MRGAICSQTLDIAIPFPHLHFPSKSPITAAAVAPTQDDLKRIAAHRAVDLVQSGMVLGLGTGSTAAHALDRIGDLLRRGVLSDIVGIPTSKKTEAHAAAVGIPLSDLDTHPVVDLSIDGADEVDPLLNLVKGRGGSLLREKMIEGASRKFVVIVDESKMVNRPGIQIIQFKEHINELNMHAEAQAREYKQKFRELEGMARQVKLEPPAPSSATSLTSSKAEKSAAKTRGSGSPFKCMGLGITQQINSEKHEELTVARHQIEELEALAASRQKEIFMLNTRLAAAESMTHDVIRDLLGVKLDMANYASLLDHHQTNKEKETPRSDSQVHQANEVSKLKKQLNEFIVERQSWLDEINEKHRELVAARILSEKLRHREQFLTAENDMLKGDTEKYKTIILELEDKVKKLSSQQNLQHRIHHHAKIKEENNWLKIQTEELSAKLHQSEKILSRVKEELARYRASSGRKPHPDIDEEERLRKKLDESEEQRIELAEKLLTLCTAILKVAGLPEPASSITPTVVEHALDQIVRRNNSLEDEVQNLRLQCKVSSEKIRLTELKQQQFSLSDGDSSD